MVKTGFGSYKQFLDFFRTAPRNVQNILYKAYPEYAARMTNDYINATKKITQKVKEATTKTEKTAKLLSDKLNTTNPKVSKVAKEVGKAARFTGAVGNTIGRAYRGIGKIAPIQGAINIFSPKSDTADKLAGAGMIGTGIAGLAGVAIAPEIASGLVIGDTLKKYAAEPLGRTIGNLIYKDNDPRYNFQAGDQIINQYDLAPQLASLTPEQQDKVTAWNKARMNNYLNQAQQGIDENQAMQNEIAAREARLQAMDNALANDEYGGGYTLPPVPQQALNYSSNLGIIPNAQDTQQGGLNINQDTQVVNPNQSSLNSIVAPVNYSNEYLMGANKIINQLEENARGQQMVNNNPYNIGDLRGYAQLSPEATAPIPQPIGIDYNQMLQQFNQAMDADRRQNTLNSMINSFSGFGEPSERAPIYYVGANGQLNAIRVNQPNRGEPLPTNTADNYNRMLGQLKIQEAQQRAQEAQYKAQQDALKAQQERIDAINSANSAGLTFGYDPQLFMNKDYGLAIIQQLIHPEAQASANIRETIGKAPTQANLKKAEQLVDTAGRLDNTELGKQYDVMIQNAKDNAEMARTMAVQQHLDKRAVAQIEAQAYITNLIQGMENMRKQAELGNQIQLQQMRNLNALDVADKYVSRPNSPSNALTFEQQLIKEWAGQGMPANQIIKNMQGLGYTNFGLTPAEQAEMNR